MDAHRSTRNQQLVHATGVREVDIPHVPLDLHLGGKTIHAPYESAGKNVRFYGLAVLVGSTGSSPGSVWRLLWRRNQRLERRVYEPWVGKQEVAGCLSCLPR
jgi:hypothetical protein